MSELNIPSQAKGDSSAFIKLIAFEEITKLVRKHPNDQELGAILRKVINEANEKIKNNTI